LLVPSTLLFLLYYLKCEFFFKDVCAVFFKADRVIQKMKKDELVSYFSHRLRSGAFSTLDVASARIMKKHDLADLIMETQQAFMMRQSKRALCAMMDDVDDDTFHDPSDSESSESSSQSSDSSDDSSVGGGRKNKRKKSSSSKKKKSKKGKKKARSGRGSPPPPKSSSSLSHGSHSSHHLLPRNPSPSPRASLGGNVSPILPTSSPVAHLTYGVLPAVKSNAKF